jgi:hypothetical protein
MTGEWRKLHNEDQNNLYCSPTVVLLIQLRMRWVRHVERIGNGIGAYTVLVGKSECKRPLGRRRLRCEDNINVDLQEVGCGVWAGLSWLRIGTGGGHL